MKQGDLIAVTVGVGNNIEILRFYGQHNAEHFSAYLHADMSTEHSTLQEWASVMPLDDVKELLKEGTSTEKQITTKFVPGDKAFILKDGAVVEMEVQTITIRDRFSRDGATLKSAYDGEYYNIDWAQDQMFNTKAELLESL